MDNKKHYLRSTRNLYYKNEGPFDGKFIKVYYSYVTPVAFETANGNLHVSKNVWSVTTGRHLTWIDGGNHNNRIEHGEFKKLLDKFRDRFPEQKPDHLKTVGLVSAMFGILSENDKEAKVKYQKRFYEKVPGLQFPDNWDQLSTEEKEKRLDGVNKIALEKREG